MGEDDIDTARLRPHLRHRARLHRGLRACLGCGRATTGTHCGACAAPSPYNAEHRANGAAAIAGATHCARCGKPFTPEDPPTRGHIVSVRDGGTNDVTNYQPEHASCNSSHGARTGGREAA